MSGDTGRQTSSEVAHEAEGTRASLASTLEQLRANLRPENVMDEVVSNAKIGAANVADNLAGVAKQYPIPAALIAAGSALIMSFFSKGPAGGVEAAERRASLRAASASPTGARPTLLRNPSTFTPAPGRGSSTVADLAAGLADARDGARVSLSAHGAALKRQISDVYESTSSQAGDAMQSVSRYLPTDRREVKSKLSNLLDEQPMILGAIGLAIGAAIGAALPITETEDSLMGTTAHRFRDTASDAARHEVDGLRAAAGEAIGNVRHSASDNFSDFVHKAGDSFAPGSRDV